MPKKIIILALLLFAAQAQAASHFVKVSLPRGVQLEVPKSWRLLGNDEQQLIGTSAEAALDLSGVDISDETGEVNLLAANSMPRSTYASVRVDSTTPASDPSSDITELSKSDLKSLEAYMQQMLSKVVATQGNSLKNFFGINRKDISGYPALITSFRRSGPKGPVIVYIVQIFTSSQDLRINLAYREPEQALWKPVIGKMYNSIQISRWP